MVLKYKFEMIEIDENIMAVPVGNATNELHAIIKLNKEGRTIFELLKNDISEEAIIDMLADQYENDKMQLTNMVRNFIDMLREKKLLIE